MQASNFRVVRAILGGGLYPNVVQIKLPERKCVVPFSVKEKKRNFLRRYAPTTAGAMAVDHKAKEVKVLRH